ncbi:hypothetical protein [Halomonas sp. MS1]|nr:hypothetical protein [Halomonas sp. MS1]UTD54965.1 hypothetical protein NF683_17730 [Halomonas sp. MS1]
MSEYTQGVCHDGAEILKDGQPLTIEQILEALREREVLIEDRARFPDRPDGVGRMEKAERELAKVEQERDALAAHVERIAELAKAAYSEKNGWTIQDLQKLGRAVIDAIGAEGMGEFAADMRTEAEKLRKEAEGHQ